MQDFKKIVVETITVMVYRVMSRTIYLSPSKLVSMYSTYIAMMDYNFNPNELSIIRYYLEIIAKTFGFKIYNNNRYSIIVAIDAGKLRRKKPEELRKILYEALAKG